VAIEGPYGTFTSDTAERERLLLVGAGVGTAPILALLHELPQRVDVTVLLRASTPDDLVLRDDVAGEVRRRGGRLVVRGARAAARSGATDRGIHAAVGKRPGDEGVSHRLERGTCAARLE